MTDKEIIQLLQRINVIYGKKQDVQSLSVQAGEWARIVGKCEAELLNLALDEYAKTEKFAPRPPQLMEIYQELKKDQQIAYDESDLCFLCGTLNGGHVLVEAEPGEDFGGYRELGIRCPCTRPGMIDILKKGLAVTMTVGHKGKYLGDVTIRLDKETNRLYGRAIKGFVNPRKAVSQKRSEQPKGFDDLDLPF